MRLLYRCIFLVLGVYLAAVLLLLTVRQQQGTRIDPSFPIFLRPTNPERLGHDRDRDRSMAILGASRGERLPIDGARIPKASHDDRPPSQPKLILIWAGPDDIDDRNLGGCPDYGCSITHDRRLAGEASAIVIAAGDPPPVRHPWQYYVFFTQESPANLRPFQPYKNYFNLTLSYRRDSDAPSPYGYAVVRPEPWTDWRDGLRWAVRGKEKHVAWFVSNCLASSRRDDYVRELSKWIGVDIYGTCGNLTCSRRYRPADELPRSASSSSAGSSSSWSYYRNESLEIDKDKDDCNRMLERDYYFYLAFENSVCRDYTTEKFWQKLTLDVVPIVLKRSIVEPYAPPGSFIAVDDFRSPRDLAVYLRTLASDRRAYERRFEWRTKYRPIFLNGHDHDERERPWGFCTLCSIVQQRQGRSGLGEEGVIRKSYEDIERWWAGGGNTTAICDYDLVPRLLGREGDGKKTTTGRG